MVRPILSTHASTRFPPLSLRELLSSAVNRTEREIYEREVALASPETRNSRRAVEELLHPDFTETGSSGETYGRKTMIEMMASEIPGEVILRDFTVDRVSDEVMLATYRSVGVSGQEVKRTSLWVSHDGRWQLRHHQGTRVADRWGRVS